MRNKTRFTLVATAIALLCLDLAKPGHLQWFNPAYAARSLIDEGRSLSISLVSLDDPRLSPCRLVYASQPLTEAKAELRRTLVGESEAIALEQLGPPACALADGGLRWLTAQGLAVDVRTTASGVVKSAKLAK